MAALALVVGCASPETATITTGTTPPQPSSTTTDVAAPTSTDSSTTTTDSSTTTTESATITTESSTTTTESPPDAGGSADVGVQARADAAAAAVIGAGGMARVKPSEPEDDDDMALNPCLGAGDFDIDHLDAVTVLSMDVDVDLGAHVEGLIEHTAAGSLEIRAYDDEAVAARVFAALEKVLGTDAGRTCFRAQIPRGLGAPSTVEVLEVDGATVGVRVGAEFGPAPVSIDVVAAREGAVTYVGSFVGRGEPFDQTVITSMFEAARSGRASG